MKFFFFFFKKSAKLKQNPLYKLFLITSIIKFWNVFPVHRMNKAKNKKKAAQRVK